MLSSNSSCSYNPFPENDTNSCNISKLEDNPYCSPFLFTNFPNSPHMNLEYEDFYHQFLDLFSQQQQQQQQQQQSVPITTHNTMPNEEITKQPIPSILIQKRLPKKDRHSKINTARGPRDRRMRLSLDVARKFFDLQDMLGFDKASRTVDWLLSNSMSAIRELGRAHVGGADSDSSANYNDESSNNSNEPSNNSTTVTEVLNCTKLPKRTKKKQVKIARPSHVARESRRKARERARERTSQKRRLQSEPTTTLFAQTVLTKHGSNDVVPIYDLGGIGDEGENEVGDNSLVYATRWNPSTLFHQNQISEFQIWGKPWEAYKGLDLSG